MGTHEAVKRSSIGRQPESIIWQRELLCSGKLPSSAHGINDRSVGVDIGSDSGRLHGMKRHSQLHRDGQHFPGMD
ncbi:hypothetical protein HPP92_004924 [Vanilla planifolia]|uniref:Uncharacterized protein n=1 Tax=Vanilla planifolia TaxID=51239 RepID=A0A835RG56_VANPL|nr:hypothetical protein HPP92_004924 [Vanilla planifolia]